MSNDREGWWHHRCHRKIIVEQVQADPARTMIRGLLTLAAMVVVCLSCQPRSTAVVPDILVGVWKTTEPKYAGQYLKFTRTRMIFGAGEGDREIYEIGTIESQPGEKQTLYTVVYANQSDQEYTWSFYYRPTNGGEITFKNRPHFTWTREDR